MHVKQPVINIQAIKDCGFFFLGWRAVNLFSLKTKQKNQNSRNQETQCRNHHILSFLPLVRKFLWSKERAFPCMKVKIKSAWSLNHPSCHQPTDLKYENHFWRLLIIVCQMVHDTSRPSDREDRNGWKAEQNGTVSILFCDSDHLLLHKLINLISDVWLLFCWKLN